MAIRRKLLNESIYDKEWQARLMSPIPPHLTPEERKIWEKELEIEKKEYERRKKAGMYPGQH